MKRVFISAVVLLAGLTMVAGCIGETTPDASLQTDAADTPLPEGESLKAEPSQLTLRDCQEQFTYFTVHTSEIDAHLPEGFEPVTQDPAGELAWVDVYALDCENEHGDDPEGAQSVWMSLFVDPPSAYQTREVNTYYLPLTILMPESPTLATFQSWGIAQAEQGDVNLDLEGLDAARHGTMIAEGAGESVHVETTIAGPAETASGGQLRFFGVDEGSIVAVDWSYSELEYMEAASVILENTFVDLDKRPGDAAAYTSGWDATLAPVPLPAIGSNEDPSGAASASMLTPRVVATP